MLKPKPATVPRSAKRTRPFSLVSTDAQHAMHDALRKLKAARSARDSGAEVAEVAVCLAAGESTPVILACTARGARTVSTRTVIPGGVSKRGKASGRGKRLTAATLAALDQLLQAELLHAGLHEPGATASEQGKGTRARKQAKKRTADTPRPVSPVAIVCASELDSDPEAIQDYRAAFAFAARHKIPILYLIANRLTPEKSPSLDLRSLYPEFGIPLFTVDAADAIAAYRVATEALHNARHLRGPCVIEALTIPSPAGGAANPLDLLTAYMERHGISPHDREG